MTPLIPKAPGNGLFLVSQRTWDQLRANIVERTPLPGENITTADAPNGTVIHARVPVLTDSDSGPIIDSNSVESGSNSNAKDSESSGDGGSSSSSTETSGGSGSVPSVGSGSTDSGGSGSKTAIVPLPDGRFIGWFACEGDEARFEIVRIVALPGGRGVLDIPAEMAGSCEPGSIRVDGCNSADGERPGLCHAVIKGHRVTVRAMQLPDMPRPRRASLVLSGRPIGAAVPWQEFTADQAASNRAFWAAAHTTTL